MFKFFVIFFQLFALFAEEKITLQLKWRHQFQFAGYYIAKDKGFYREKGLEVDILESKKGGNSIDEILNGSRTFAIVDSSALIDRLNKKKIVALFTIYQESPQAITVTEKSKIKILSQLNGKKIILGEDYLPIPIQAMLLKSKVSLKNVESLPNQSGINDILANKADAIAGYITNEPFELESKKIPYKVFLPSEVGVHFYSDLMICSEEEISKNPERVEDFKQASLKGWEYALNHIEEAIKITQKYNQNFSISKYPKEYFEYEAKKLVPLVHRDIIQLGDIDENKLIHIANTFIELGLFQGEVNLDGFIFNLEKVKSKKNKTLFLVFFYVFVLVFIFIIIWSVFLKKLVTIKTKELTEKKEYLDKIVKVLEKSEKQYKIIIDHSKDLIFTMDTNYKILSVNKSVLDILKFSPSELISKDLLQFIYFQDSMSNIELTKTYFMQKVEKVYSSEDGIQFSSVLRSKTDEPVEVTLFLQIVSTDENPLFIGSISPIEKDETIQYIYSEKKELRIGNHFMQIDSVIKGLTSSLSHFVSAEVYNGVKMSLREVIINSIEHGNLEIDFELKTKQQNSGEYLNFLIQRQKNPIYKNRKVSIKYELTPDKVIYEITDDGNGFDSQAMLDKVKNENMNELYHGRGLLMIFNFFDKVIYNEKGNSVLLEKKLK
jgi:PAS domain S-box-containing protein